MWGLCGRFICWRPVKYMQKKPYPLPDSYVALGNIQPAVCDDTIKAFTRYYTPFSLFVPTSGSHNFARGQNSIHTPPLRPITPSTAYSKFSPRTLAAQIPNAHPVCHARNLTSRAPNYHSCVCTLSPAVGVVWMVVSAVRTLVLKTNIILFVETFGVQQ